MLSAITLSRRLDALLKANTIPDYPQALNGLQMENSGSSIKKIGAAVDASLSVIQEASKQGVDFLICHHGLFWQGTEKITGAYYKKIKILIEANIALYSAHIPLDIHPEFGNNILLANDLGVCLKKTFMPWKGIELGICGEVDESFTSFFSRVKALLGERVHCCAPMPQQVGTLGIITGGAGSQIKEAAKQGITTFLTGEGPHWSYPLAEELGVNVIYAGHYATETLGVCALGRHLASNYNLQWDFIDYPTGL